MQLLKNFEQLARRIPVFLVYIGRDFPIAVIPLLHIPVPKRIAPRKPLKVPGKGALSESLKLRPGTIDVLSLGPGQRKPSTLLLSFQIQEDVDDTVRAIPQQLVGILDGLGREKGFRVAPVPIRSLFPTRSAHIGGNLFLGRRSDVMSIVCVPQQAAWVKKSVLKRAPGSWGYRAAKPREMTREWSQL